MGQGTRNVVNKTKPTEKSDVVKPRKHEIAFEIRLTSEKIHTSVHNEDESPPPRSELRGMYDDTCMYYHYYYYYYY